MVDLVVQQDAGPDAGCVTWWQFSGLTEVEDLRDALAARGLPEALYPRPPTAAAALARAAQSCLTGSRALSAHRELLRPLKQRGRWEVVLEKVVSGEGGDQLAHECLLQLRLSDGRPAFERVADGRQDLAGRIEQAFDRHRNVLDPNDLSSWAIDLLARRLQVTSLRERGGFYFVPREQVEVWRAVAGALHDSGPHQVSEIPAARTEQLVQSVLRALRAEAAAKLDGLREYLSGTVSVRGLNAVDRDCADYADKLDGYAELLQVDLADLVDKLNQVKGAAQAARILAEAEREREAAE